MKYHLAPRDDRKHQLQNLEIQFRMYENLNCIIYVQFIFTEDLSLSSPQGKAICLLYTTSCPPPLSYSYDGMKLVIILIYAYVVCIYIHSDVSCDSQGCISFIYDVTEVSDRESILLTLLLTAVAFKYIVAGKMYVVVFVCVLVLISS
jgi:hypothetical protein